MRSLAVQAYTGSEGSTGFRLPGFSYNRHLKVARFPALRTGRPYPPGKILGTHFCCRLSQPQGHIAAGRLEYVKHLKDLIGNRTCDLPTCSAVVGVTYRMEIIGI